MKKPFHYLLAFGFLLLPVSPAMAQAELDTTEWKTQPVPQVVVTGVRNQTDQRHLPYTVSVIPRQEIEQRYSSSLLTVLNEQVPGFFATSRGVLGYGVSTGAAGQMNIRGIGGSPTTQMMVLIDGHPQYAGIFGHPISDAYQDFLAEKVEVVRGPASALYGSNAMGGVINIVTRKMEKDGNELGIRLGGGSYGTVETEATDRFKTGRLSGIGSFSYNRSDNQRANMGFEQMGGFLKLNYKIDEAWNAVTDLNIIHFNASNPGTVQSPIEDNDQHIARGMWSVGAENDYGWTSGAAKFFYNFGHHKINDGYSAGQSPKDYLFKSNDHDLGVDVYQGFRLFEGNRTTFGFNYQSIGGRAWNDYATNEVTTVDTTMNEFAGYIDFRQDFLNVFTLDLTGRIDHHSTAGTEFVPQIGLATRLPHQMQLKATVGKGFRNPTLKDLFMYRPKNPDLEAERIWNYEIAFEQHLLENRLHYGLNVYYLNGDNLIQTVAAHNENTGRVHNWGIEVNGCYQLDEHWNIKANYSYIHQKYQIVGTPQHKVFAGSDYAVERWLFSAGVQWINHLTTSVNPLKKESFVLLNARASYKVCKNLSLFAKGENLLAQRYELNYGFPMPKATFMGGVNIRL